MRAAHHIDLHYLPNFVPGAQTIFCPAKIAVPPTTGISAVTTKLVRYAPDGTVQTPLVVADPARTLNGALIKGLADAGLVPMALDANPAHGKPPEGADFILASELEQFEVHKRFGANQTIHGQYFTMHPLVRVKYDLRNRDGAMIYWARSAASK